MRCAKKFFLAISPVVLVFSISVHHAAGQLPSAPVGSDELNALHAQAERKCSPSSASCLVGELKQITVSHGPTAALEVLRLLQKSGRISASEDDHQIAHQIGRQTAQRFGVNGHAFLLCSTAFNYGCQHGFFEYALGRSKSPQEAAVAICGPLESEPAYSGKFKFYCYHGVGHGVLMARAYDLRASLQICDALPSVTGQEGCWQGVFMENVNAGMRGEARSGVFSKSDPLLPCSQIADKYRRECYINHAGYLMVLFKNSIGEAARACLNAGAHRSPCVHSLGLMTTNPSWQRTITGRADADGGVATALDLCATFPASAKTDCLIGALDHISNYDELDLSKRAIPFCQTVQGWTREACYRQIGVNIARQVADTGERRRLCGEIELVYRPACLAGAAT